MTRISKNKPSLFRVAIVGEGETEWYYFNNMKHVEKFRFEVKPDLPKHSDYMTIINTARRKRDEGYDLVFCVLDMDRIISNSTEYNGYISEKSKTKKNKNIEFIETMPCIELWFLLHFIEPYSNRIYLNYDQIIPVLKTHFKDYDKTEKFLKGIRLYEYLTEQGDIEKASNFAKRLLIDKKSNGNKFFNYTLMEELISKLKR